MQITVQSGRGALRRVACALLGILISSPICCSGSNTAIFQPPGQTTNLNSSLVKADAVFDGGNLVVSFETEEPTEADNWKHIYIDADLNEATGRRLADGSGADYLVEGKKLYQWIGGGDQKGWHWKPIMEDSESIAATVSGKNRLSYLIPLQVMGLKEGDKIRIFIEIMSEDWKQVEDVLPRKGSWEFKIPRTKKSASP